MTHLSSYSIPSIRESVPERGSASDEIIVRSLTTAIWRDWRSCVDWLPTGSGLDDGQSAEVGR